MQSQQVGASRLRAIETGRWEVQAAPTGFSAFISPEGTVLLRSAVSEARVEVRKIPLRDGQTIYLRRGPWPPFLLGVATVVASWLLPPGVGAAPGQTSSITVTGPSLTRATSMSARKRPVATSAP